MVRPTRKPKLGSPKLPLFSSPSVLSALAILVAILYAFLYQTGTSASLDRTSSLSSIKSARASLSTSSNSAGLLPDFTKHNRDHLVAVSAIEEAAAEAVASAVAHEIHPSRAAEMEKLVPSNPMSVMVIRQLSPSITTLSVPFARFGRLRVGGRGTLVKLPSGGVAVFSPVALTEDVQSTVTSLGPLKYIIPLDFEHHVFLGPWHKAYPDATVVGIEGLAEKRAQQKDEDVRFDITFTAKEAANTKIGPDFDDAFDYEYIHSHANKELVFYHRPEKTLIQADLLFNLPAVEQYSKSKENPHQGFGTRLFNSFQGTTGSAATWQKRFIWYVASSGDRPAFNESVRRINGWDFERIIPCHGDVIENGGKDVFRRMFGWHLPARAG